MTISIAEDFSKVPVGRFRDDGEWSAERFREDLLIPALKKADKKHPVIVNINGVEGYSASFLEEAFAGLIGGEYTREDIQEKLQIEADDTYDIYKKIILTYLKEG